MNKKILNVLTGISALAIAGLISIIPSSKCHASVPSQAPSPTTNVIHIYDYPNSSTQSPMNTPAPSPMHTDVPGTVNWTFTNINLTNGIFQDSQDFRFDIYTDNTQDAHARIIFIDAQNQNASVSASYNFAYNGQNYAGTVILTNQDSQLFDGLSRGNFIAHGDPLGSENEFMRAIDNTVNEIGLAVLGLNADGSVNETRTVQYKSNYAISPKIIAALAKAENVTFIYTFEYEGIIFQSFITPETAAAMYSPTIAWYGPCYIATYSPTVPIGFVK